MLDTVLALVILFLLVIIIKEMWDHKLSVGSLYRCMRMARKMDIGNTFLNFWYIYNEIYELEDYQPFEVPDGGVVLDIGGNMGLFSCWADEHMKGGTIYVFEPIPDLMKIVKNNTSRCKNTIKLFPFGLGDKQSNASIDYFPNANGLSTIDMADKNTRFENTSFVQALMSKAFLNDPERVDIEIIRLDSMAAELPDLIHFVKIDVEGFELAVLRGFGKLVSRVQVFVIEVESFKHNQLLKIIRLLHPTHFITIRDDIRRPWNIITAIRV